MGGMNEWGVCAKRNGFRAWREGKKEGAPKTGATQFNKYLLGARDAPSTVPEHRAYGVEQDQGSASRGLPSSGRNRK